jgi:AAA ATPase domain
MYLEKASALADQLMHEFNGKHLSDLERSIIEGVSEGKKYGEIAEGLGLTSGHVTDAAAKLWQALSQALGEKVTKKNFKSSIGRYQSSIVSSHRWKVGTISFCGSEQSTSQQHPKVQKSDGISEADSQACANSDQTSQKYLLDAPAPLSFYGRTTELAQLQTWLQNHSRLILIHASSGTGKTALARQLIAQNQDRHIIWQSLQCHRPLTEFLDHNITPNFSRILTSPLDLTQRLNDLIDQLTHQSTLIILDDLQEILWSQQLAGSYAPEYRQYQQLFDRLVSAPHHSTILLLSQEIPRHLQQITECPTFHILTLNRLGDAAQEIFQQHQLIDSEYWPQIIAYYSGNPQALNIIATIISQFFGGSAAAFVQTQPLPIPDDCKQILQRQLDRLATREKTVIQQIATGSVTINELQKSLDISPTDIIDVLQSLDRRGLLQKNQTQSEVSFEVDNVLQEFLRSGLTP